MSFKSWIKAVILLLMNPGWIFAKDESSGMITIEIIEDPSFFELYHNQILIAIIIIFLALFFLRRYKQRKTAL